MNNFKRDIIKAISMSDQELAVNTLQCVSNYYGKMFYTEMGEQLVGLSEKEHQKKGCEFLDITEYELNVLLSADSDDDLFVKVSAIADNWQWG